MSNSSREAVFSALAELSSIVPEMRASQLVAAVGELCTDLHGRGLWEATDAEFLEAIWKFQSNVEASSTVRANLAGVSLDARPV